MAVVGAVAVAVVETDGNPPAALPALGLGIGWRPANAWFVAQSTALGFVEILAEDFAPTGPLPAGLAELVARGVRIVPHGVSLGLGGAEPIEPRRLDHLAALAARVQAPFVSEHIAFVRAGGREAGHLLPVPRTAAMLDVMTETILAARRVLGVPLVLENIAAPWQPPGELDEATFLTELLQRTDCQLLLDLANLHANAHNHGFDAVAQLAALPLSRLAYVHVAGGVVRDGFYHDTHEHPIQPPVVALLAALAARTRIPAVLWEHDGRFGADADLAAQLAVLAQVAWPAAAPRVAARAVADG